MVQLEAVNLAVLMGLMVRMTKLFDTYLMLLCEHRMDMALILARCSYDTAIDLLYLCQKMDKSQIGEFIDTSLATSKAIYEFMENDDRTGSGDPVTRKRIRNSIEDDFREAGRTLASIQSKGWQRKVSTLDRAKSVGLERMHVLLFRNLSRPVHGSWSELVKYHLTKDGEFWRPNLEHPIPSPQMMSSSPIVIARAASSYADKVANDKLMPSRLLTIEEWFKSMSYRHEEFLRDNNSGKSEN